MLTILFLLIQAYFQDLSQIISLRDGRDVPSKFETWYSMNLSTSTQITLIGKASFPRSSPLSDHWACHTSKPYKGLWTRAAHVSAWIHQQASTLEAWTKWSWTLSSQQIWNWGKFLASYRFFFFFGNANKSFEVTLSTLFGGTPAKVTPKQSNTDSRSLSGSQTNFSELRISEKYISISNTTIIPSPIAKFVVGWPSSLSGWRALSDSPRLLFKFQFHGTWTELGTRESWMHLWRASWKRLAFKASALECHRDDASHWNSGLGRLLTGSSWIGQRIWGRSGSARLLGRIGFGGQIRSLGTSSSRVTTMVADWVWGMGNL